MNVEGIGQLQRRTEVAPKMSPQNPAGFTFSYKKWLVQDRLAGDIVIQFSAANHSREAPHILHVAASPIRWRG